MQNDQGNLCPQCATAVQHDAIDSLAGLGRWSLARGARHLCLSATAMRLLGMEPGDAGPWSERVVPEDRQAVDTALAALDGSEAAVSCEFRLVEREQGVRWLRLQSVAAGRQPVVHGMLTDITMLKRAALRERFNFALTQYLIGTDTLDEAVYKIIHLVCEELGWEWGAFWALDRSGEADVLRCRHIWHKPDRDYAPLRSAAAMLVVEPGQGVVGQTWRSGQSLWVDASAAASDVARVRAAAHCGLQSGFFFPVTYVGADGRLHSVGVLEFFSAEPRQREAQLPGLAESISALIAQAGQRMVQQERVRVLAQTDEMTGLYNRAHFHALLDAACARGERFGLLYIDLDQFKPINDGFGHAAGNLVLCQFAERLRQLAPAGASVARLGGDEFALMTPPGADQQSLDALAAAILDAARARFNYLGHDLSVSASIGVSLFPLHGADTAQLLHAADAAMYQSKRNGRNLASYFGNESDSQQRVVAAQLLMLSALQDALQRNEFFVEYQPIRDLQSDRVVGLEALIRWRRADGSIVPPDQFVPVAEQSRLIVYIGRWVIEQVCRDLPLLQAAGLPDVQVHVNMAAPEFLDDDLPHELMAIVDAAGVDPARICLELTEGVIMRRIDKTLPIMRELVRLGFEISLDDFGMGYSSLSLLKTLPISSIKIDRVFLQGVPHNRNDCAIVRTIIDLGLNMQLRIIAEGVECDAQLGFLRQFDCTQVQGYLSGRPTELAGLLARHGVSANLTLARRLPAQLAPSH
ncbi:diguanylate cyclase/phosphodiesterase [Duganella sp. CF402]|uniref:putative bifunctional diguanylate cyclase/phosphodiesterase n=1 Tax=unclassified Duganella TaxID=2636909 RepID=UPI0008D38638|nr:MULTISPECIES: EAL domain-containing protein [unclassified Duganella]RZT10224.1 diguanylate cyclase (GGDEF)-like protein [Duganella sp. BK701]SEL22817.1 diguanylate cyclase/phosphodiesterase [Duganella sp. CF402]